MGDSAASYATTEGGGGDLATLLAPAPKHSVGGVHVLLQTMCPDLDAPKAMCRNWQAEGSVTLCPF